MKSKITTYGDLAIAVGALFVFMNTIHNSYSRIYLLFYKTIPTSKDRVGNFIQLTKTETMKLGVFSNSLAVKDLVLSRSFYEKLGFVKFGGDESKNYLIMKNEDTLIGLFQGMFEGNIMTFNPGWNTNAQNVDPFTDARELQKSLKDQGVELISEADESTTGPASFILIDPDGNQIMVDQHR